MRERATSEKQSGDKRQQKLKQSGGCVTSINNSDKRQNNLVKISQFIVIEISL